MASRLLHLPAELKLHIIENLSVKDLHILRRTCREFNGTVSSKETHFANVIQSREIQRLQDFIDYHFNHWSNISFPEALRRWVKHRGIFADNRNHDYSMRIFAGAWRVTHEDISINIPVNLQEGAPAMDPVCIRWLVRMLAEAADVLVKVHVHYHEPQYKHPRHVPTAAFLTIDEDMDLAMEKSITDLQPFTSQLGLSNDDLLPLYWELRCGFLKGPIYPPGTRSQDVVPENLVTRVFLGAEAGQDGAGFCTSSDVKEMLSVPALPPNGVFTYYMRNSRALEKLQTSMEHGVKTLKPFEHAAMMEDLFIY